MTSDPPHLLDIDDLDPDGLEAILERAAALKRGVRAGESQPILAGRTLAMIFEKPSTRTRVSFETGMTQLGGHAIFLGVDDIQLGRGEPLKDTARSLSRYVDAIMARVFDHGDLKELASYSSVPVINALSDRAHPCQTLADLLTIREQFRGFDGVRAAWVGDGNNVAQSFAIGCALAGIELAVATPPGYEIDRAILERAADIGSRVTSHADPAAAVTEADVVYTDVWTSMGDEGEREQRLADFDGYRLDKALLSTAPDALIMHCLPAHRGEEITDEVIESERSIVFDQAENRLHAQKGLLAHLIERADQYEPMW